MPIYIKLQKEGGTAMLARLAGLFLALALLLTGCQFQQAESTPTPTLDPVPANTYAPEAFSVVDGFLTYNGDCPSIIGVDVSSHQKEIDWAKVSASGVKFAMIRAAYRGYTQGSLKEDEYFRRNIEGAAAAGLDVGVYLFSQAVNEAEAVEEAGFLMGLIKDYDISYPVVFDWERQSAETSRTKDVDGETITNCAQAFCSAVEAAGYLPMVYFSPNKAYNELDLERLLDWPFWLAHYTDDWSATSFRYHFAIWQYSPKGAVDGIDGDVDLDLCLTDFGALKRLGTGSAVEKAPLSESTPTMVLPSEPPTDPIDPPEKEGNER